MKKKNSRCEFASERSEVLLRNFRESLARQSQISTIKAFRDAALAPAPRFWVSEARAMRIVSSLFKGKEEIPDGMHPKKQEMYREIFRRVNHIKSNNPEIPLGDIVFQVVNDRAPESYLTWEWASKLIRRKRNRI